MNMKIRSLSCTTLVLAVMAGGPTAAALASSASPASKSVRSALVSTFGANDGNASEVRAVYVSKADSTLAVVCVRTPEAGNRAYVFHHVSHSWRLVTSGAVGRAGNSTDRTLEHACG